MNNYNFSTFSNSIDNSILVVEDCEELRDIIVECIRDNQPGLSIETASDGVEALDKIAKKMPSMLITNINMPRMNGITLLITLQEKGVTLPTLATSGWWTQDTLEKELASQGFVLNEMISFLQKPFRFEDFRRLVDKLRQTQ